MELRSIAIIPARAGSKRLPGKNFKTFNGRPLIDWTVRSAIDSKSFDNVIITTNDDAILNHYAKNEAVDLVERSACLASDDAKSVDVVLDVLAKFGLTAGRAALLQPTSPLRKSKHIEQALSLFNEKHKNSVVSVKRAINKIEWCKKLNSSGYLEDLAEQDSLLDKIYIPNGAIYVFDIQRFLLTNEFYFKTAPYLMDDIASLDIDYPLDFEMAQLVSKQKAESRELIN